MEHINGITKKYGIPEVHGTLEESLTHTTELNMNHYTSQISVSLAEKLKEKGMPIALIPRNMGGIVILKEYPAITYAEVFDWLMSEKEMRVYVVCCSEAFNWRFFINYGSERHPTYYSTWHEAANAAIEQALTLI